MTANIIQSRLGAVIVIFLTVLLVLMPLGSALNVEASESQFSGFLMDVTGTSTNGHFAAAYAWLADGDLEIFVAFMISKKGAAAYGRQIQNLSYDGVDLFGPGQTPEEGTHYWYQTGLTVNGDVLDEAEKWLVVSFGVQTLTDPMVVGMTVQGHGFSVSSLAVPITLHTVTYNANGGEGVVTDPTPTYFEGDPVTVMENAFTKAGNRFTGWKTEADGTGTAYEPGDVFTMPNHNVVLYAQWEEARTLTITASDQTKIYGDTFTFTGTEFTVVGLEGSDSVTSITLTSEGGATDAAVGTYPIVASAAVGEGLENYTITFINGSLAVTKAALTITANDLSKVYDGLAYTGGNGVTYAGFATGDDAGDLTGTLTYSGTSQGAVNTGTYVITPGGLTSDNYAITFVDGSLEVTKAALTITAKEFSKVFDGVAYTGGNGVTYAGFATGDDASVLGGTLSYSGTSQGAVNAGTYVITPGGLTSDNYTITFVDGSLAITKYALTITANDFSKVYDGLAYTGGNGVTYAGFANGDDASVLTGTLSYSGTSQGAINAGTYVITPGGLTSENYTITFVDGSLEVTIRPIQVTADNKRKGFGQADPALTYQITNGQLVVGDEFTGSLTREDGEGLGTYRILQGNLALSANYDLTFIEGKLEVVQELPITGGNVYSIASLVLLLLGALLAAKAKYARL